MNINQFIVENLREKDKLINWSCDIYDKTYSNTIWSFYCTFYDYDFCLNVQNTTTQAMNYLQIME